MEWDPDEAENIIAEEKRLLELSPEEMAKERIRSNAPLAAESIINLAKYSYKDEVRLRASTYIIDRAMGRIKDDPMVAVDTEFEALIAEVVVD